jgi:uncharacterized protein (TIGR03083 family)
MAIDYVDVIEAEAARIGAALEADRQGRIPWSDSWTVVECARHVGSVHHVVAEVVEGRPTASFSLFKTLTVPDEDDPGVAAWFADGAAAVANQLRTTDGDAECWSWWPEGQTVAFWRRRMAHETLVHRWDAELGAGIDGPAMDPSVAADALDEFLDVFVGAMRFRKESPAGPSIHLHCTDTDGEWMVELPAASRVVTREHAKADVALRGSAEALLLTAWGRVSIEDAGVDVVGDASIAARLAELLPSI